MDEVWVTKDDKAIPVKQMKSSHLLLAHRYLCETQGFGSLYWIPVLGREIKRRKLNPLPFRKASQKFGFIRDQLQLYGVGSSSMSKKAHKSRNPKKSLVEDQEIDMVAEVERNLTAIGRRKFII